MKCRARIKAPHAIGEDRSRELAGSSGRRQHCLDEVACIAGINCGDASATTSTQLGVRSMSVTIPVVFKRLEEALTELS